MKSREYKELLPNSPTVPWPGGKVYATNPPEPRQTVSGGDRFFEVKGPRLVPENGTVVICQREPDDEY